MPRRNRTPKHLPKQPSEQRKVRYTTRAAAERQIRQSQQYNPGLVLSVYQSPTDGGWYLTSSHSSASN